MQGVQEMTKATTWMIDIFKAFIAVLLAHLLNDYLSPKLIKLTCEAWMHVNALALGEYCGGQQGGRLKLSSLCFSSRLKLSSLCFSSLPLTLAHRPWCSQWSSGPAGHLS